MKKYETIVVFKSEVTKEYINTVTKKLEKIMKSKPGNLIKKDDWGIKKFAYPVKKEAQGRYIFWYFENTPDTLKDIDKALRFDEEVLRYMTILTEEVSEKEEKESKGKGRGAKTIHVDYKDPTTFAKYLTERGKIIPRRVSGINAKSQRRLSIAVKRSRQLALMSFTEGFYMRSERSERSDRSENKSPKQA